MRVPRSERQSMGIDSTIFDLLDDWRHLPDYQLERRADIFFAAYLPGFLSDHFGVAISPRLIPEFPIHLATIRPGEIDDNRSCKMDYLAIARDHSKAYFIELKTDPRSRRDKQNDDLGLIQKARLPDLLCGVLKLVQASQHTRKYCHLLRLFAHHGLMKLPPDFDAALKSTRFRSEVGKCLSGVEVSAPDMPISAIYLQPKPDIRPPILGDPQIIVFTRFAGWLE